MFPSKKIIICRVAAAVAFLPGIGWATDVMAEKTTPLPITIEADEATLQEQDGASIYRGHVTLIQGGLRFDADEVRVESVNGKLSRMVASGSPVKYQQNKPGQKSIAAEAKTIEYLASSARAIFRGDAKLIQGVNSFSGDKIEYDTLTDTVKAGSREKERVKIVIQPNGVAAPSDNKVETPKNPQNSTESVSPPSPQPSTNDPQPGSTAPNSTMPNPAPVTQHSGPEAAKQDLNPTAVEEVTGTPPAAQPQLASDPNEEAEP